MKRICVYFNTSILIRAVNPREPGHKRAICFICELSRNKQFVLVYSDIHFIEGLRPSTELSIRRLFSKYGFVKCRVSVMDILIRADAYIKSRGYSTSKRFDVAHTIAAQKCGCSFITAIVRFIRTHALGFGLKYINYYTGIP